MRKAEKAGQNVQVYKKSDHANKHSHLDNYQYAKIMNDEDDHKRTAP